MNISEVLDIARIAAQKAEEMSSNPTLAYEAARRWEDVADVANNLADVWKQKGGARARAVRYSGTEVPLCHECHIPLVVEKECPDCGNTYGE